MIKLKEHFEGEVKKVMESNLENTEEVSKLIECIEKNESKKVQCSIADLFEEEEIS